MERIYSRSFGCEASRGLGVFWGCERCRFRVFGLGAGFKVFRTEGLGFGGLGLSGVERHGCYGFQRLGLRVLGIVPMHRESTSPPSVGISWLRAQALGLRG